jgi:hypothetical protein
MMKMGSGAAATRLKCPAPRVTSSGLHAKSNPASHASSSESGSRLRTSRNVAYAVSTESARNTTLKLATTPSHGISGSASRFANVV